MIQSIKKAIITRFIKLGQYAINSLGGETKAHYISPKGLYSRSITENGLVLQILEDEGNKFVIPLQKAIDLDAGDVIITDDKSFIHFRFSEGIIDITTDELILNVGKLTINGSDTNFIGGTINHDGTPIDKTHGHEQGNDSAGNTQVKTDTPS